MQKLILSLLVLGLSMTAGWAEGGGFFTDVCPDPEIDYCKHVGKLAYDYNGMFKLGQIVGVTWRSEGAAMTSDPGKNEQKRVYYYLIDDGTGSPNFVRQVNDVTAK